MSTVPPPPPSGFQPAPAQWQQTTGLRTASIVLFWVVSAAVALFALAAFQRKSVWEDSSTTFSDLEDADSLVAGAFALTSLTTLAAAIVVSIWALRAGRNAQLVGARDVSPGLACGSWYIPIAWLIVPFIQVRRMARARQRSRTPIGWWQGLFIGGWVAMATSRSMVTDTALDEADDIVDQLQLQGVFAIVSAVLFAGASYFAMSGMRNADGG
jgi:hypothetical protein